MTTKKQWLISASVLSVRMCKKGKKKKRLAVMTILHTMLLLSPSRSHLNHLSTRISAICKQLTVWFLRVRDTLRSKGGKEEEKMGSLCGWKIFKNNKIFLT